MKLVFVTNNKYKFEEIKAIIPQQIELLNLADLNFQEEIVETGKSLHENAYLKAHIIYKKYRYNCFADDTGLEIEALNQEPGIYSARYAGKEKDFEANIRKVLKKLEGIKNRRARFRTVISLFYNNHYYFFEGIVNGVIITEKRGTYGFGYDPIFIPDGYNKTFAEMPMDKKNKISHRAIAFNKLVTKLMSLL